MKTRLDRLYAMYNRTEFIDPDPLLFLWEYPKVRDREIAGMIAASLAYGRVEMIMKAVSQVLAKLLPAPYAYLMAASRTRLVEDFSGFRYRFADQEDLVNLLWGVRRVVREFGSLEDCFCEGWQATDESVIPGLIFLADKIRGRRRIGHLLADPKKTSACKRSHLYLRWMVRQDEVDPGGWHRVRPGQLIVPLDRHMHRAGRMLGFTRRKNPDLRTAIEITDGFKRIMGEDPVRYDFSLTRFGIRREMNMNGLKAFVCPEPGKPESDKKE